MALVDVCFTVRGGARSATRSRCLPLSGSGEANINDLIPDLGGDGRVTVRAHEDSTGHGSDWWLTAYAICGVVNGDMEITRNDGAQSSADQSVVVNCPDGYTLFSGGVDLFSTLDGAGGTFDQPNDRLVIDKVRPSGSLFTTPRYVTISVLEASASPEIWWPDAYAVCFDPA